MASKSKTGKAIKAETVAIQPAQKNGPSPPDRPSSPLDPIRHSRLVEKTVMQNNNDRLASYIDKVRYLENENARLNALVQTLNETRDREIASTKQMYENDLSASSKLVDELTMEKAKIEMDIKRLWEQNADLKTNLGQKCKEAQISEDSARLYESKYKEIENRYNAIVGEHKKAVVDAENLKLEVVKLRKQCEESRKNLEKETVDRIDSENTVRSLREQLKLKDQLHNGELNESGIHRQIDADSRLAEQYKAQLQEALQELRDQYEDQMRSNREEIESLFEARIKNGQNTVQRDSKALNSALEYFCTRVDTSNLKVVELEQTNSSLNNRIRDLEFLLASETARSAETDVEMNRLHEEMTLQLEKYQDLMDIKVSLDLEIAAYGKLLTCEDHRLGELARSSPNTVRGSPAAKRNRNETCDVVYEYAVISTSTGDIEISEVDPAVKCVKLHNKSEHEVALGGWQLIRKVAANETVHQFHASDKIDGGADLIIWSADSGVCASPINKIMEARNWLMAKEMRTTLVNSDGKEEAITQRVRQQRSIPHSPIRHENGHHSHDKCCTM